jgi:hypothetical protein
MGHIKFIELLKQFFMAQYQRLIGGSILAALTVGGSLVMFRSGIFYGKYCRRLFTLIVIMFLVAPG